MCSWVAECTRIMFWEGCLQGLLRQPRKKKHVVAGLTGSSPLILSPHTPPNLFKGPKYTRVPGLRTSVSLRAQSKAQQRCPKPEAWCSCASSSQGHFSAQHWKHYPMLFGNETWSCIWGTLQAQQWPSPLMQPSARRAWNTVISRALFTMQCALSVLTNNQQQNSRGLNSFAWLL